MDNDGIKRITVFSGHYGSGKTNIAVNYALWLREKCDKVLIADLDIVNPYFRTKDSASVLAKNNIELISSEYANSNVDVPALPAEMYSVLRKDAHSVIDVGGDDRGALALGRFSEEILASDDYEMLFVVNKYRPMTRTVEGAIEIMREIENACHIKFTSIVNNSNIGEETRAEDIENSMEYAQKISEAAQIPIKMTTVKKDLISSIDKSINAMPISLYVRQSFEERNV